MTTNNQEQQDPFETLLDWLEANHPDWESIEPDDFINLILEQY